MRLIQRKQTARHLPFTLLVIGVMSLFTVSAFAQSPTFIRTDYPCSETETSSETSMATVNLIWRARVENP
jgi:hypothetical protein